MLSSSSLASAGDDLAFKLSTSERRSEASTSIDGTPAASLTEAYKKTFTLAIKFQNLDRGIYAC